MRAARKQAARARATAAALVVLLAVAAILVLMGGGRLGGWVPGQTAGPAGPAAGAASPDSCASWAAVDRLADRCMAELPEGEEAYACCGGAGYTCQPCSEGLLQALRCVSPRRMLLRPAPGCGAAPAGAAPAAATPRHGGGACQLSSDAVAAGRWLSANMTPWGDAPGMPGAFFLPAVGSGCRWRPLAGPAVLRCLRAARLDRIVISGDSTVRQMFTRLVSLLRQQVPVIDGGGMVHGHYTWQAWQAAPGGAGGAGSGEFATDRLWYSPTANHIRGVFNQTVMQDGLRRLTRLSAAAGQRGQQQQHAEQQQQQEGDAGVGSGGGGGGAPVGAGGGRTALIADFLVGSRADWQQRHVRQYLDAVLGGAEARRGTLMLLSLCVWEVGVIWPKGWLEFVGEVQSRVGQLVLLTCPTDRLRPADKAKAREVVAQRNALLRQMVAASRGGSAPDGGGISSGGGGGGGEGAASSGGGGSDGSGGGSGGPAGGGAAPLLLLDLDALTQRVPARATIAPEDYHYQCYLQSNSNYQSGALAWAGGDGAPTPHYPPLRYDHLRVPLNAACADPVNFAAWQLLLSMLC